MTFENFLGRVLAALAGFLIGAFALPMMFLASIMTYYYLRYGVWWASETHILMFFLLGGFGAIFGFWGGRDLRLLGRFCYGFGKASGR